MQTCTVMLWLSWFVLGRPFHWQHPHYARLCRRSELQVSKEMRVGAGNVADGDMVTDRQLPGNKKITVIIMINASLSVRC